MRGLLTDGKRKSMVPMAARLSVDHQQLQPSAVDIATSPVTNVQHSRRQLGVMI
uniref:hypothetical protein n=1 Tax=Parafrankia discariae TaxID=365528 RepID=UPI00036EAAED|nr:hypothetical protein [Parafrankia discariae]